MKSNIASSGWKHKPEAALIRKLIFKSTLVNLASEWFSPWIYRAQSNWKWLKKIKRSKWANERAHTYSVLFVGSFLQKRTEHKKQLREEEKNGNSNDTGAAEN